MAAYGWRCMSAVTSAAPRFSTSNTTCMCSTRSRGLCPERDRWRNGVRRDCGPRASTGCGRIWQERLGKHPGTRAMVDLLLLAPVHGWPALRRAAEEALSLGCTDASAVAMPAAPVHLHDCAGDIVGRRSRRL